MPMIERWIEHNDTTADSLQETGKIDTRSILFDKSNNIDFFYIDHGKRAAGIVAHRSTGEFLDGAILWVEPEFRGKVSMNEIFDSLLDMAKNNGKLGIRFESKIWGSAPKLLGFELVDTKQDGADTVCVWQKMVTEA